LARTTTKKFRVTSTTVAAVIEAYSHSDVLEVLAKRAGYPSWQRACYLGYYLTEESLSIVEMNADGNLPLSF